MAVCELLAKLAISEKDIQMAHKIDTNYCNKCIKVITVITIYRKIVQTQAYSDCWRIDRNGLIVRKKDIILIDCYEGIRNNCKNCDRIILPCVMYCFGEYYMFNGSIIKKLKHSPIAMLHLTSANITLMATNDVYIKSPEIGNVFYSDYSGPTLIYFDCLCEQISEEFYRLSSGDYISILYSFKEQKHVVINEMGKEVPFNLVIGEFQFADQYAVFTLASMIITINRKQESATIERLPAKHTKPAIAQLL